VKVYYVDDNGVLNEYVTQYDAATGTVSFVTDHFSYWMVTAAEPAPAPEPGPSPEPKPEPSGSGSSIAVWIAVVGSSDPSGTGDQTAGRPASYRPFGDGLCSLSRAAFLIFSRSDALHAMASNVRLWVYPGRIVRCKGQCRFSGTALSNPG